jgi:Dolichyl-phosphate-mannose-protein mannosyltransferase
MPNLKSQLEVGILARFQNLPISPARWRLAGEIGAVGAFLGILFSVFLYSATARLFWFDELFTLHLAQKPLAVWSNLANGADNNPPLSYWLTAISMTVFGPTEWAVRVPAMLGGLASCLCVYLFVRHRRTSGEAFLAMTVLIVTAPVWVYFLEARPYSLLIAFTAMALLSWQREWRLAFIASMTCGMLSHYYFVVPAFVLFWAEVARVWQNRKINRGMLIGFLAVAVALAATYPIWGYATKTYQAGFWAKVKFTRSAVEDTFHEFYRKEVTIPVMFALCVGVLFSRKRDDREAYPLPETVALVGLALGPLIGVAIGAKLVGAFYYRYILASILGFAVLFAFAIARTSGNNRVALALASGAFILFGAIGNYRLSGGHYRAEAKELHDTANFLASHTQTRVIVESPFEFSRIWQYHGKQVAVAFLADTELAMKHTQADTVDRGIQALARFTTAPVWSLDDVTATVQRGEPLCFFGPCVGWHSKELTERGIVFTPVASRSNGTLFQLTVK